MEKARSVADKARGAAIGVEVHEPKAADPLVPHEVGVAQELVATADGRQHAPVLHEGAELGALRQELVADDALLTVGPSAYEGYVHVREGRALAHVDLAHLAADPAPGHAAPENEDVARVAVEVQELRIEVGHTQDARDGGNVSHGAPPFAQARPWRARGPSSW